MNPKLIALQGPLKGNIFELAEDQFSIGRDPSNRVSIPDKLVSRSHAIVKKDSGCIKILDLQSYNKTYVNGIPIAERVLQPGDQIQIGESVFGLVSAEEDLARFLFEPQLDEMLIIRSEVRLRQEDSLYVNPGMPVEAAKLTERVANDLKALLAICAELNTVGSPEALELRLLQLIFEVIPADSGTVVLLNNGSSDEFASTRGWSKRAGLNAAIHVSGRVVQKVAKEGTALMSNDVCHDDAQDSLVRRNVQSVLAVPIRPLNKMIGVIYLEGLDPSARFDGGHLQFMMGVAAIAGIALENARRVNWLQTENRRLNEEVNLQHSMIGESPPMLEIYQFITKVAPTDSTVLLLGESGTGKELAARAIHINSPRAQKPFMAVNCAALIDTLLESELFGHEKGAFTGAVAQKKGKIEVADGGTLFLDEIGELAPVVQAKLLRVLQEREFQRVGGTQTIKVNIRLIAATNKNLKQAMNAGRFRQDLYFRLNVVSLNVPPLRERRDDIPLLANYFTSELAKKIGRRVKGISAEAQKYLKDYDWPGNIRELQNAIERAIVLGTTEVILAEDLPEFLLQNHSQPGQITDYHQAIKEAKRQLVLKVLEQVQGNYVSAARLMGIHPNNLHRLIRELNLKRELKK